MRFVMGMLVLATLLGGCSFTKTERAPEDVVKLYLRAVERGDARTAWALIHPNQQTTANLIAFKKMVKHEATNGSQVIRVRFQKQVDTWADMRQQNGLPDGHTYTNVTEVEIEWDKGHRQVVHLVHDSDGAWRLIWSPQFSLE